MADKIKKSAKGEDCSLQIFPFCRGDTETTVLAHLQSAAHGIALKSPDWWAVYACQVCHDIIDGRLPQAARDIGEYEIHQCILRGLFRTHRKLIVKGLIVIKN